MKRIDNRTVKVAVAVMAGMSVTDTANHLGYARIGVHREVKNLRRHYGLSPDLLRKHGATLADESQLRARFKQLLAQRMRGEL